MKMQFHLSSALLGLFVAALLLGANMRPEGAALKGEAISWALYGWPFRAFEIEYYGYTTENVLGTTTNWYSVFGNILVALSILFLVILPSEILIRRRKAGLYRRSHASSTDPLPGSPPKKGEKPSAENPKP